MLMYCVLLEGREGDKEWRKWKGGRERWGRGHGKEGGGRKNDFKNQSGWINISLGHKSNHHSIRIRCQYVRWKAGVKKKETKGQKMEKINKMIDLGSNIIVVRI